jgi:hypothetical protein
MIKNIKNIIIYWYYWNFKIYENIYLNVTHDFLKFDGFYKIKVWHSQWYHQKIGLPYNRLLFIYLLMILTSYVSSYQCWVIFYFFKTIDPGFKEVYKPYLDAQFF